MQGSTLKDNNTSLFHLLSFVGFDFSSIALFPSTLDLFRHCSFNNKLRLCQPFISRTLAVEYVLETYVKKHEMMPDCDLPQPPKELEAHVV